MSTVELREDQWPKILEFLRSCPDLYFGQEGDCKRFVEAILWMARSGAAWRLLPEHYGHWNSVYKRFARWCDKGVWDRMHQHFVKDPDMEYIMIDSTAVRAHPCGSIEEKGGQAAQALGRSRGGFSTKIHVSVDALGNPLRFTLTGGQRHDITQAEALIVGFEAKHVIGDKGYDSAELIHDIMDTGAVAVIPPRSNRKTPREYDKHLYKERHLVECFINKIKHYRHIFSRFDKLASRYFGFLSFVGTLMWLR